MALTTGQTLSHYTILGPLGSGAMGEVYRARDTRLKREVAIKVLPEELAADVERLKRFEREARSLASLSHPHVAHVYEIDKADTKSFMTMELVPGQDLARHLSSRALPVSEALTVCLQIAEGVEAAHEAGVIHRDLKPANAILTPDGQVKLLDFGLAKPIAAGVDLGATMGSVLTQEDGSLIGTPGYMSPEQIRGQGADKRVDVWAFGCVLFECLTGEQAFGGESLGDALAGVLQKEPDWSRLPSGTPRSVRALLRRCLDKDPRTRLRDMGEARIALAGGAEGAADEPADDARPRRSRSFLPVGIPAVALVAYIIYQAVTSSDLRPNPLHKATWSYLTNYEGTEYGASISPDGNWVSFVSDKDGPYDFYTSQVGKGRPLNRTLGSIDVWHQALIDGGFSADSSEVWLAGGLSRRLQFAPLQGGEFTNRYAERAVSIDWTRDGTRAVYHTHDKGDPVYVAVGNEDPGAPILRGEPGFHQHFPTWSYDDERIFVVRGKPSTDDMDLWWALPDGTDPIQLTWGLKSVQHPAPIDERTVVFAADDRTGGGLGLWVLDLETGEVQRGNYGVAQYTSVSASADGRRLVATASNPRGALWEMPIREELVTEDDVQTLEDMPSLRALAPRFSGEDLYYFSSRGTGDGLWRLRNAVAEEVFPGGQSALLSPPAFSSDGRFAALLVSEGPQVVLTVVDTGSFEVTRPSTEGLSVRGTPCWSPDDDWLLIGGTDGNGPALFKIGMGPNKGRVERFVEGEALNPVWSPKGDMILFTGLQVRSLMPLRAVDVEGNPLSLPEIKIRRFGERYRFLPDGSGLVYMQGLNYSQEFHLLDLTTLESRQLSQLDGTATMRTFDIRPDGLSLVFGREDLNADIVLIELDGPR